LLRQRGQEFETLAENLPDLIARYDRERRFVYVNAAIEAVTGVERGGFIGRTQREVGLPAAVVAVYDASLEEVMATGRPHVVEFSIPDRAGGERAFEAYHVPERDAAGNVATVLCVARDITERRRVERELRDSKARFDLMAEGTGMGLWDWDIATGRVWRHPLWMSILGYEAGDLQPHVCVWQELCHPDDWPQAQEALLAHFEGRALSYAADYRLRDSKGSWIWVGCRGKVIERGADGEPQRMIGYIRDITARKRIENALRESEERFRQIAENIREVFWINAPGSDHLVYVSPAYEEVWGRSCESLYRHPQGWMEPIHPDDLPAVRAAQEGMRRGDQTDVEYRIIRADGTVRWIRDRSYPMKNGDGTPLNCGFAEDIPAQKRAQEERLTHAIHQRDALVREVHHRIKNHLQGIAGLLRNKAADHPAVAGTIESAVAQLQSVAVVYGLQSELAESGVPLCRVLEAICASAEGLSATRVVREFSADPGRTWLADNEAVPVAVALNELVYNAIEHGATPARPQTVEVELVEAGDGASIRIVNHGRLPARFDYRRGIGTGTGLDLVRTLLGPAGDKLNFRAREGRVEVTLDLCPPLVAVRAPKRPERRYP
jgi:PAS domain S-box-containing protein